MLKWKIEDGGQSGNEENEIAEEEIGKKDGGRLRGRRGKRDKEVTVSARKLAAGLWKLQLPDTVVSGGSRRTDQQGFQVS